MFDLSSPVIPTMSTDDSRERLLTAAAPIFSAKGFDGATVREICTAAGVNPAAINYHFGDKRRLYVETIKRAHRRRVESAPVPGWPANLSPEQMLYQFIRTFMHRILLEFREEWETDLMLREILHPTEACRELVEEYIRPEFELLLSILQRLLPPDTPSDRLKKVGFGVIGQCIHYRVAASIVRMMVDEDMLRNHFDVEGLARHIWESTLAITRGFHEQRRGQWRPSAPTNIPDAATNDGLPGGAKEFVPWSELIGEERT